MTTSTNSVQKADRVFHEMDQQTLKEAGDFIRQMAAQLDHYEEMNPPSRLPEKIFVESFLPLFAGEMTPTNEFSIATWVTVVAKGPTRCVHVVDQNDNVLFTVPPIYETDILDPTLKEKQGATKIINQYHKLLEVDPASATSFLGNSVLGLHMRPEPTERIYNNVRVWDEIFARYGRKTRQLIRLKDEEVKDTPKTQPESESIDYEIEND